MRSLVFAVVLMAGCALPLRTASMAPAMSLPENETPEPDEVMPPLYQSDEPFVQNPRFCADGVVDDDCYQIPMGPY